eukprot:NODE_2423_length_1182_cov_24.149763_g2308_i0.p1 GENE.NODE_2423_length_1182_cov_24.149763_g2308_i0~~NODE_2423_length_1182_cov_24.149763_g2308_i0.p1  ORF type:complete len:370 (+),score=83.58 NODE_2423_length_1182_cov_24.149763_g2308_i0:23-1111(+)
MPDLPDICLECLYPCSPGEITVTLSDGVRHKHCQNCLLCTHPLPSESTTLVGGHVFHSDCADLLNTLCLKCNKPLHLSANVVQFENCNWHPTCFNCEACSEPVLGDSAIRFRKLYHRECLGPLVQHRAYIQDERLQPCPMTLVSAPHRSTLVLYDRPLVKLIANVLTPAQCRYIQEQALSDFHRSEVGVSGAHIPGEICAGRSSSSAYIPKSVNAEIAALEAHAAAILGCPVSHLGRFHVGHYAPGQHFGIHYDTQNKAESLKSTNGYQRVATLLVYLVDMHCDPGCPGPANGHTVFPLLGLSIPPIMGAGVYFQNIDEAGELYPVALHAGAKVCCGAKWVLNIWAYNKPMHNGIIPVPAKS